MKKIIFISLILIFPLLSISQFSVQYPYYEYARYGDDWNGYDAIARPMQVMTFDAEQSSLSEFRIVTKIPITRQECYVTVYITGYDEANGNTNLQIGWHSARSGFVSPPSVTTAGSFSPLVSLGTNAASGTFSIRIQSTQSEMVSPHFEVKVLVSGGTNNYDLNDFLYWEVDQDYDAEEIYPIENKFNDIYANNINSPNIVATNGFLNSLSVTNNKSYYVNRIIPGETVDNHTSCPNTNYTYACRKSYLILHQAYNGQNQNNDGPGLDESYVMGKITAIRGGQNSWNYKLSMDVNTSTAYKSTRGSLVNYMQDGAAKLVTVNYMPSGSTGASYRSLAIEINNPSSIYGFSFTGYAANENLILVAEKEMVGEALLTKISNVVPFTEGLDPISLQGPLKIESLKNINNDLNLTTDEFGNVKLSNNGGYWKKQLGNNTIFYNNPVAIGNTNSSDPNDIFNSTSIGSFQLVVGGKIGARKMQVTQNHWADYVFNKNYKLKPLSELEKYIKTKNHLPDIPTTAQVIKDGVDVGEMQRLLLKKIEELTLYIIEQQKQIDALKEKAK